MREARKAGQRRKGLLQTLSSKQSFSDLRNFLDGFL